MIPSDAFTFRDRVEVLEYRRGDDVFLFGVGWRPHVRLYADAETRTAGGRLVDGDERRAVLAETVAYLRTRTRGAVEVVGEPDLGDHVRYTVAQLRAKTRARDCYERNVAIHELQNVGGEDAARVWYRVIRKDPEGLCVSSAFGLLLRYAGTNSGRHRDVLFDLADSAPGRARAQAMARLDAILDQRQPGLASRLRRSRFANALSEAGSMFVLLRAITYATLFIGLVLVFLPAELLSRSGVEAPEAMGWPQVGGMVVTVGGALLALWCILSFALIGRGTPAPFDPPRRLVVRGPYARVRNPMYLGAGLALLGAAIFYQSLALLGYAGSFFFVTHAFVVLYEEPVLRAAFGGDYASYCREVGRWWPRMRGTR